MGQVLCITFGAFRQDIGPGAVHSLSRTTPIILFPNKLVN
jgi:hypothetical protein